VGKRKIAAVIAGLALPAVLAVIVVASTSSNDAPCTRNFKGTRNGFVGTYASAEEALQVYKNEGGAFGPNDAAVTTSPRGSDVVVFTYAPNGEFQEELVASMAPRGGWDIIEGRTRIACPPAGQN